MTDSHDRDVRAAFDALRRETQAWAPSFATLTSPQAFTTLRRRHRRRRAGLLAAVAIVPVFLALRLRPAPQPDFERFSALTGLDPGSVTWKAPSDFLLEVPGRNLLRTIPLIDVLAPVLPADSARPADTSVPSRRRSDS